MIAPRLLVPAALAALAALGCGGADSPETAGAPAEGEAASAAAEPAAARRPLCARLRPRITGRVRAAAATELSGLVVSRSQSRVLWAHNDSGDRARLLALAPSGRLLADLTVPGAEHVDWEDIATGGRGGPLYVGDIGDNAKERPAVVVYRLAEPRLRGGGARIVPARVRRLALRYPDRAHDAEALLVDPSTGGLVVVTKDFAGVARVYVADRPSRTSVTTMRRAGRLSLGAGQAVTAGDVSGDGRTVVLRTYDSAFVWSRRRGQSLPSAMRRRPCRAGAGGLPAEGQAEALALTRDGRAFFTVAEGRRPLLRRYAPAR